MRGAVLAEQEELRRRAVRQRHQPSPAQRSLRTLLRRTFEPLGVRWRYCRVMRDVFVDACCPGIRLAVIIGEGPEPRGVTVARITEAEALHAPETVLDRVRERYGPLGPEEA